MEPDPTSSAASTRSAHGHAVPVEDHRALVASLLRPGPVAAHGLGSSEHLEDLLGLTLAEPVRAVSPVPPMTNSAMDGFAVRHRDLCALEPSGSQTGLTLPVSQDVPAGALPAPLAEGTAARIMTGAALPPGADTVVRVEATDHQAGDPHAPSHVTIAQVPRQGADVRHRGEDVQPGATVLEAGECLDAASLAAAISVGCRTIHVYPRPRVGIISTGSELREPGSGELLSLREAASSSQQAPQVLIPDSNGPMLEALVRQAGAQVTHRSRVPDHPQALLEVLGGWEDVDLVLTAGGISQGAFEVVRQALGQPGGPARMSFHHVAQQPGGPQGAGTVRLGARDVPVLSLPGNPVSSFVTFHLYVAPALAVLAGAAHDLRPRLVRVRLAEDEGWSSPPAKLQLMPVLLDDEGRARRVHTLGSGSHLVASLARGHALAMVPAGISQVRGGQHLDALPTRLHALPASVRPLT